MTQTVPTMHIKELAEMNLPSSTLLLDVRTPAEYADGHLSGAVNIPLSELEDHLDELRLYRQVLVYCRSSNRSNTACQLLTRAGIQNSLNLDGGIVAWREQGLQTVCHQRGTISIDRQVKLIAGVLILTGLLLSQFVHPAFIGLTAFVGAGLTFAGSSNICMMAILLSKMPWNQVQKHEAHVPRMAP